MTDTGVGGASSAAEEPLRVRRATRDDAAHIARVRVETWRAAYRGLIDTAVLDRLDMHREATARAARWDEHHADPRTANLVAELRGEVVGWAAVGPTRDAALPRYGELYALYVLPAHWSRGVGHALIAVAEERLRAAGFRRALLWVLEVNERAAAFYERHGWVEDGATLVDDRLVGGDAAHALHERRRVTTL